MALAVQVLGGVPFVAAGVLKLRRPSAVMTADGALGMSRVAM